MQVVTYALFLGKRDVAVEVLKQVPRSASMCRSSPMVNSRWSWRTTKTSSCSIMNLRGMLMLQRLGLLAGVPLPDERLKAAVDFLRPYAAGEKKWPYPQINGFRPEGANYLFRWVDRLPATQPADLENLTGPRLAANPADSN